MRLAIKFAGSFLPLLLLLLLQSGCTYALWTNGNLVAYKEPAQNPDLHVFQSTQRNDFLIVYHEHSERTDSIHTRAYWLNKNQRRVEDQKAPAFAHHNPERHLSAIPVFYTPSETNFAGDIYAVCDTNKETFTLFSGNREIGSYDFPVYHDHWGNVEKAALTPVALTADVTVAGGIVAFIAAYEIAQGGYTIQVGK
ncbi:MAG TPA: hypothetical protein VME24_11050 [Alphaproteobacteria bacterium]|nr:hypothetical protein [Alphaproteobacteria bacterium]